MAQKTKAREAYKAACLGLKIVSTPASHRDVGDITMSLAGGEFRTETPPPHTEFRFSSASSIRSLSLTVTQSNAAASTEERKIRRYREVAGKEGYGSAVTTMSAFDSLQALSNGLVESTSCCICLDALGSNDGSTDGSEKASVSMTKCGVGISALVPWCMT